MKNKSWKRWVIVTAKGDALPWTLSGSKKWTTEALYYGMNREQRNYLWEEKLKDGYSVVKVNVNFEIV